jgi:putative cell wall-binding protein
LLARLCSTFRRVATGGALLTLLGGLLLVGLPLAGLQSGTRATLSSGGPRTSDVTLKVPAVGRSARVAHGHSQVVARLPETPTRQFGVVGVTWDGGSPTDGLTVQIRTHGHGGWSGWQDVAVDTDTASTAPGAREGTDPIWVGPATGVGVRLLSADGRVPADVKVAVIDGGTGLAQPAGRIALHPAAASTTTGGVAEPDIVTRAEWGSMTKLPYCSKPRYAKNMRGVVIHHTVNSNDYTAEQAPGIVRAIQMYHVQQMGWCDVGYNFLVDRFGTIYEGRRGGIDKQVRGAHAGNWDVNLYTTGIAMIGNFQKVAPPPALKRAVVHLSAWRLSLFGHRPFGTFTINGISMRRISGHRDVNLDGFNPSTATACPGQLAYDWIHNGGMRKQVRNVMDKAAASQPPAPTTSRLAGSNRFETAAAIADSTFSAPVSAVFLSSGLAFPDALSAGPAAVRQHGPVLLTKPRRLPAATADELQRLHPATVYVVGGPAAVSDHVANVADQYAGTVVRLGGSNRYATGMLTAKRFWSSAGTVYLASGLNYPDALSGGALAAHRGAPILLARPDGLPRSVGRELTSLSPSKVVVLGGPGALSSAVVSQVKQRLPGATVTRLAGTDRYGTSAAVASTGWSSAQQVYFAVGTDFPDALAGVPAAAAHGSPLLLTQESCLPSPVYDVVGALAPSHEVLLGGSTVLGSSAPSSECP